MAMLSCSGHALSSRTKKRILQLLALVVLLQITLIYMKWNAIGPLYGRRIPVEKAVNESTAPVSHPIADVVDVDVELSKEAPPVKVAMAVVLKKPSEEETNFKLAIATQRCYAGVQGYPFHLIYMEHRDDDPPQSEWERAMITKCLADRFEQEHKLNAWGGQLMFDRLCALAELLAAHPEYDYVLFLDADIGVINPERRIEEFIDYQQNANLVFYERGTNLEFMSGAFLAKNTAKTRKFLTYWYNYTWELASRMNLPHDTYGFTYHFNREQGTIHEVFMELFADKAEKDKCDLIFYEPRGNGTYDTSYFPLFVACQRHFLNKHVARKGVNGSYYFYSKMTGYIQVLAMFKSFVRDGTYGLARWNYEMDFMLHDWKEVHPVSEWVRQIVGDAPFDSRECSTWGTKEEVIQRYWKDRFQLMVSREELEKLIEQSKQYHRSWFVQTVKKALAKVRNMTASATGKGAISQSVEEEGDLKK